MKRLFLFAGLLALSTFAVHKVSAQEVTDSVKVYRIETVAVTAIRAAEHQPIAQSSLTSDEIAAINYGEDMPTLLSRLPSVVVTSESGTGIGSTAFRVRGTDPTRINVTMNGVPMNDAETHSVYWYDTPDVGSSVGSLQLQRGIGTSTNGTGAFGASLNMTTQPLSTEFRGSASLSYGSFNTNKQSVAIESGLLGGHWAVGGRLSHIGSDGYIERASSRMLSYMFQAAYYGGRTMVKLLSFGGKARVYLAYTGLTADEMAENRRRNVEGEIMGPLHDAAGNIRYDADGNPVMGVVGYYDDHSDNYLQLNNQLIVSHIFNDRWSLNATLHYTRGDGYYQNYKNDQKLSKYGLQPIRVDNIDVSRTNLVRRKSMLNDFGGAVASLNYRTKKVALSMGLSANIYDGVHFGEVLEMQRVESFEPAEYYRNATRKYDANVFAKVDWQVARSLNLYADLQYRHITHRISGVNDNFDDVTGALQRLDVNRRYNFVNPKLGVTFSRNGHTAYGSVAMGQKEPTRNNFTDIRSGDYPTAELMIDGELGYRYESKLITAGVNFYYMYYHDQLVLTGELSDTGELLSRNVPRSYRRGIELMLAISPLHWLTFEANTTLSQNHILDYTDYIDDVPFYRGRTTIAYSPSVVAAGAVCFSIKGFDARFAVRYVGSQYMTNGEYADLRLDSYTVADLHLAYTLPAKRMERVRFGIALNNLFNTEYCSNGYGGSWLEGATLADRKSWACYFPQAKFNVLANVTVNF